MRVSNSDNITSQDDARDRRARRLIGRAVAIVLALGALYLGYVGIGIWGSWNAIEREPLDTARARQLAVPVPETSDDQASAPIGEGVPEIGAAPEPSGYESLLLIGTDEAAGIADVILLTVVPGDGMDPFLVSLPRDLYVPNHCTGSYTRINATLHGCGDVNGPTALSLAVEDFTGLRVDHFAMFDFEGFASVVDGVGGIEICVDHPRTDWRAGLELDAGCTTADGTMALAWVRSRHPREQVDGRWRNVPGSSDLTRNHAQQDVLLQMLGKLNSFGSPGSVAAKARQLADAFVVDEGLQLGDAIRLGWSLRGLDVAEVTRIEIPVTYAVTEQGQSVLEPTRDFDSLLAEAYPGLVSAVGR